MSYKNRIIDEQLKFMLSASPSTLIVGPKWCGKTTSAKRKAISVIEMDDPINRESNINFAKIAPNLILDGVSRDPNKVRALMRSFSRNISTQASIPTLISNLQHSDNALSDVTVNSYLNVLKKYMW